MGLGTLGLGSLGLVSNQAMGGFAASARGNVTDLAVLNFALNLEYLEAEYYTYAVTGNGIESVGIGVSGAGDPGGVTVPSSPQVPFSTDAIRMYASEIAEDERAHVAFIRGAIERAGGTPVARPAVNLRESFAAAAAAAGLGPNFNPFADELSFLIGAFIFEDVGVTAYKGAAPLIANSDLLEAAAGIMAVEAYHAGTVRTLLYQAGETARNATVAISTLRDSVDGADETDEPVVRDGVANIVPANANGLAHNRTPGQVLNIVYLSAETQPGGFFPNGINGDIK